jgi:hypothetical protein
MFPCSVESRIRRRSPFRSLLIIMPSLFFLSSFCLYFLQNWPSPRLRVHGPFSSPFRYYLVIVAIFKNEVSYLPEWIEYHASLGVEKFYLYDNDSIDKPLDALCPYIRDDLVNYTYWPGRVQQLNVYNFALEKLRWLTYWFACIDVDEFIVPIQEHSIPKMMRLFEDHAGLIIYWMVYGSGGQLNKTEGLVIERFVDHIPLEHEWNHIVKSIVNPRVTRKLEVHEGQFDLKFSRPSLDCLGNLRMNWLPWKSRIAVHSCIRINHYWTKSYEEWLEKAGRGIASTYETRRLSDFRSFGMWYGNNDTAIDLYIPAVRKGLSERKPCVP